MSALPTAVQRRTLLCTDTDSHHHIRLALASVDDKHTRAKHAQAAQIPASRWFFMVDFFAHFKGIERIWRGAPIGVGWP